MQRVTVTVRDREPGVWTRSAPLGFAAVVLAFDKSLLCLF